MGEQRVVSFWVIKSKKKTAPPFMSMFKKIKLKKNVFGGGGCTFIDLLSYQRCD